MEGGGEGRNVVRKKVSSFPLSFLPSPPPSLPQSAGLTLDPAALASALALLQAAHKPLLVFGKGAAYARAEGEQSREGGREEGREGGREEGKKGGGEEGRKETRRRL